MRGARAASSLRRTLVQLEQGGEGPIKGIGCWRRSDEVRGETDFVRLGSLAEESKLTTYMYKRYVDDAANATEAISPGTRSLLVQGELRNPPGNYQESWKFPGTLKISRGPGFFQALEISREPGIFQVCAVIL